ncbi:MAG: hypothetical protein A2X64_04905 [Ignavibacteria bacterium GWF2_33_9]|nr:MAG: hypothetical protein A2X64_04905 [Ignavibacteria bacterium GWF2_33_9]
MKNKFSILLLLIFAFLTANTFAQEVTYKLNLKKSLINWSGRQIGKDHKGTIKFKSGELVFKNKKLISGTFVVDMSTIENTDLDNKADKEKLETHLKSPDFFDVAKYPEAKLTFKRMDKKLKNDYFIIGNLTIKNKRGEVMIPASLEIKDGHLSANIMVTFDRTKFDVKYRSKTFFKEIGDKLIYDDIDLNIFIEADK